MEREGPAALLARPICVTDLLTDCRGRSAPPSLGPGRPPRSQPHPGLGREGVLPLCITLILLHFNFTLFILAWVEKLDAWDSEVRQRPRAHMELFSAPPTSAADHCAAAPSGWAVQAAARAVRRAAAHAAEGAANQRALQRDASAWPAPQTAAGGAAGAHCHCRAASRSFALSMFALRALRRAAQLSTALVNKLRKTSSGKAAATRRLASPTRRLGLDSPGRHGRRQGAQLKPGLKFGTPSSPMISNTAGVPALNSGWTARPQWRREPHRKWWQHPHQQPQP
eukprot:SAG31_NODE_3509_length_4182_cov_2.493020_3_plen_282_part_00